MRADRRPLIDALLGSTALAKAAVGHGRQPPVQTVLVVAPATVLDNWCDEMEKWCGHASYGCFQVRAWTAPSEDHCSHLLLWPLLWHRDRLSAAD